MSFNLSLQQLVRYHKYRNIYSPQLPQPNKIRSEGFHCTEWSQGTPSERWSDSTAKDSDYSCSKRKMTLLCHCGHEAKVIKHHNNYRWAYTCYPKRVISFFFSFPQQTFPQSDIYRLVGLQYCDTSVFSICIGWHSMHILPWSGPPIPPESHGCYWRFGGRES